MNQKIKRTILKIKENCKNCGGEGCHICGSRSNRIKKYSDAGIPSVFWDKTIKDFYGNKIFKENIKKYATDIDSWYDSGKSILMVGSLGTGKSYMGSCCLKLAIVKGYSAMYINMMDIINNLLNEKGSTILNDILNKDFVVIDEFDSRWIFPSERVEQIFSSNMEYIFRNRFQNGLPTIICSNTAEIDDVIKGYHSKAFASLKEKYADVIFVAGGDLRRKKC